MEGIIYNPNVHRSVNVAMGAGYNMYSNKIISTASGLSLKYFHSSYMDDTYTSLSICFGSLIQIINILRLGIVIQNTFPGFNHLYVTPSAAFKFPVTIKRLHVLDVTGEISYTFNYSDNSFNTTQKGIEAILFRTFSIYFGTIIYNDSKYVS